ncbi:RNA polymerase II-associated protein 1 isoform X2 [Tamandua tetradactyla]|uniref:RNA polymerase II-associated protein 1 isoform X2 n=1 Tax=Tamandua tetradactyla TaxID=48850 RepID=UPI0040549F9E
MLLRPKPGESEVDLLRFQNEFLSAGAVPAVQLVKKGRRRGGAANRDEPVLQDHRDVVMLDNLPDLPPALVPAPSKRARTGPGHPLSESEDPEERLNRHDQHITAVLTKIIERDTSSVAVNLPVPSGFAFPPVFHRSKDRQREPATSGKRSIFAQEIAARREFEANKEGVPLVGDVVTTLDSPKDSVSCEVPAPPDQSYQLPGSSHSFQGPHLVTGKGLRSREAEQEAQTIHEENIARLQAMAPEEILQEQQRLLAQLDPSLISFLRSRSCSHEQAGENTTEEQRRGRPSPEVIKEEPMVPTSASESRKEDELEPGAPGLGERAPALPVTPHKEWLHMDTVELEKLHWTRDLPPLRQQQTQERMQARFSLQGELLAPDVDLPTHLGLHHHGEEAERAGYSLQELFHLTRSQVSQQRALALHVLAQVISRAQAGEFGDQLVGSVLRLLLDAGFLFLLRFSLDDRVDGVIVAAVRALRALLVAPGDEELLDRTFSWYHGASVFPLIPSQEDKEDEDEDEEPPAEKAKKKSPEEGSRPPPDLARQDVIKGLLATNLLPRLRYVLEVACPGPAVVLDILAVLIRLARHSLESATRVLECPRLIETVVREFLPTRWAPTGVGPTPSLHRVPCAAAMKLLRVLASAGRNIAARLLNSFDLRSRLCRFIAEPPQELALPSEEAEALSTESYRLWTVAAIYGQDGDLYRELYPVLIRALQAVSQEFTTQLPQPLSMQRIASLLTLLTQLTLAATSDSAKVSLSASSSITWTQVSGLRPLVEPCLRRTLKLLPKLGMWTTLGPVPAACILFLDAYYQAWSQQPSLCPGDWLQDMEQLLEELLLPLLSQPTLGSLWDSLRCCSPLCNPLSCAPAPEALPSLVSLGCSGGCPPLSLAGSASPFPFLTALLSLFNTLARIHKGLCGQVAVVLAAPGLQKYFLHCVASAAIPHLTPFSAWALRHEHHLQYLALTLAQRATSLQPALATSAPLHHGLALALLSRLLPGSEHLAHELLLSCVFRPEFLPERASGGPEAADFSDRLCLGSSGDPGCGRGVLLARACQDLPSIRSCYLTHCSPVHARLLASQALYRGERQRLPALLLPVPKEPLLPTDWPFLPLIHLYHWASDTPSGLSPDDTVGTAMRALQWVLVLESWRPQALQAVPPAARLARLMCVFLVDSELFRETPIQQLVAALLARLCQPQVLQNFNLDCPLPGLTSFPDLYANFLEHFEAVSFGDHLFGALVLLPLQRRFSVTLRLALFGEHVGALRALGLPLTQLYFRALVTGALRSRWCPVLYAVAVAHVNGFIFSQDPNSSDEVKAACTNMLQKTWLLADEGLRQHLLYYKLPNSALPEGFELYSQLPPLRQQYLQRLTSGGLQNGVSKT